MRSQRARVRAGEAGYESVTEPARLDRWPVAAGFVIDPDGYLIEIIQYDGVGKGDDVARVDDPVIVEAAINGAATKASNPNVPITPDEHVADILASLGAGAAIVHHHDALAPTPRADRLAEVAVGVFRRVLAERPDALCYPATVWGGPIAERLAHHRLLAEAGLLRVAFLDSGSTNFGAADAEGLPAPSDFIYAHSPREVRW